MRSFCLSNRFAYDLVPKKKKEEKHNVSRTGSTRDVSFACREDLVEDCPCILMLMAPGAIYHRKKSISVCSKALGVSACFPLDTCRSCMRKRKAQSII